MFTGLVVANVAFVKFIAGDGYTGRADRYTGCIVHVPTVYEVLKLGNAAKKTLTSGRMETR